MRSFIKNLVRTYFNDHSHEFGENAHFSEFLIAEGTTTKENSYPADVYGYIMYVRGKTIYSSRRIRVQYYRCRGNDEKRLMISSWFANDAVFYSQIWPLCVDDSTRDLVPKFCASGEHISSMASMGAMIFECDAGVQNWGYMCRLDYVHLALMAQRIGQLHGRVLKTRAQNDGLLSRASDALTISVQLNASSAIPRLECCLDLLEDDLSFLEKPDSMDGIRRLKELISGLDDRLHKLPVVNPNCFIICHRNYSQACGFFRYNGIKPVEMKIGYWAKVGWSSLADDLVILMFVDADPQWKLDKRVSLVEHYIAGLRSGCPDDWVPTSEDIWREIRLRIPFALFALASRVDGLSKRAIRSGRLETSTRWNDQFVVDVYKFLISNHLV